MSPKAPPPPAKAPPPPANGSAAVSNKQFAVLSGRLHTPQRVLIYGTGGIGKSSLAALAPNPVFLDLEAGTNELDVPRIVIESWADLRACLQSDATDGYRTVVIDSTTVAQELCVHHVLRTVPNDRGGRVDRIEDYGFGKGYQHVYETFLLLLQDIDGRVRKGQHVILIAHDCTSEVPNPQGDNYIRYEPHLQQVKSGKASIRNRVVQWVGHVLFLNYDVIVDRSGKGQGGGTRTIFARELPTHIAKVREREGVEIPSQLPYEPNDPTIWNLILGDK